MELRIRFTIQLKFIYSICQTLYHWPGRGITPAFRTEKSRKLALPVPLPGLQHIARASLLEIGASLCLISFSPPSPQPLGAPIKTVRTELAECS